MSLLMEALRKAEQGKDGADATGDEMLATASNGQEEDLLSLDLPDDLGDEAAPDDWPVAETREKIAEVARPSPENIPAEEKAEVVEDAPLPHGEETVETEPAADDDGKVTVAAPLPGMAWEPGANESGGLSEETESVSVTDPAESAEMAEILFQAKRGSRKQRRLVMMLLGLVLLSAAGLGGWYYFILEADEGQFQSAALDVDVPRTMEPEVVSPVPQTMALEDPTAAAADGSGIADAKEKASPTASASLAAQEKAVETAASAPSSRLPAEQEKPPTAAVETSGEETTKASSGGDSKATTVPAGETDKPTLSAEATYQRAMDEQVQTGGQAAIEIRRSRKQVKPSLPLNDAWKAFGEHRYSDADVLYQAVLAREPFSRDALLGRAAVAMRRGRVEQAHNAYLKLLERDPRDPLALAGLIALQGHQQPNRSLSRIQQLIAANPDVPGLYFVLGNLYAGQSRWAYAQQAYFKAYAADPEHPEYLFNLAVSLDHLGKKQQSLGFYRRALELAEAQPVKFSAEAVSARIKALERGG